MTATPLAYNLAEAIDAAQALLPHVSREDVTPVLVSAKITASYWVATDRYSAARRDFPTEGERHVDNGDAAPLMLPLAAVEWVAKLNTKTLRRPFTGNALRDYRLEVFEADGAITAAITIDGMTERSQAFDTVIGNYPAVENILDGWEPAVDAYDLLLDPAKMERVTTFVRRHRKDAPVRIELGKSYAAGKAAPIRFTIDGLTVLLQPNRDVNRG